MNVSIKCTELDIATFCKLVYSSCSHFSSYPFKNSSFPVAEPNLKLHVVFSPVSLVFKSGYVSQPFSFMILSFLKGTDSFCRLYFSWVPMRFSHD